jgi:hypothetical protein
MERYLGALEQPVLQYTALVPDYDPSTPDIVEPF